MPDEGRAASRAFHGARPQPSRLVSHQLATLVAEALHRDASALGSHWERQARSVAPRLHAPDLADDAAVAGVPTRGERVVRAVATALARRSGAQQELVRAGWEVGATAHGGEQSLHYLLKELNLLSAVLLYACEQALTGDALPPEARQAPAAEGIAVARRIQRSIALLTLAATKGFAHDYLTGLRDHFRALRHDLRNPLGTIRSAITLMDDQSVEPEMRNHPRFRAMVVRNASNLDRLIGGQLSDDVVLDATRARQAVSLYEVALSVRRELRDEAAACGCRIEVDAALPEREVDPVGVELALRTLVSEALGVTATDGHVRIGYDGTAEGKACVLIVVEGPTRGDANEPLPTSLLEEVARWSGGGKASGTRARSHLEFVALDSDDSTPPITAPTEIAPRGDTPASSPTHG